MLLDGFGERALIPTKLPKNIEKCPTIFNYEIYETLIRLCFLIVGPSANLAVVLVCLILFTSYNKAECCPKDLKFTPKH